MKFSSVLLAACTAHSSAYTSPKVVIKRTSRNVATLDAPSEEEAVGDAPAFSVKEPVTTSMDVEKVWPIVEFVKDSDRVLPGRYGGTTNSIALPFLPRPTPLDGTHAGDYGFDPLGLAEKLDLYTMQESELRHSRLAMLAVVGWPISELLAPDWMLRDGCAPSVLNGVNPLSFLAIVGFLGAAAYFEMQTSLRSNIDTPMGKQHAKDMSAIWKYGVAGDYNWDPLNFYSSCGNDWKGRKGLREVEVSHGRMAMLGISYFAAWEALTGHPIVENNILFHPNAVLPLLAAGYLAWSQVYEISPLNEYPIGVKYTNEGEMKLKRFQNGVKQLFDESSETTEKVAEVLTDIDEKYDIVEKLAAAPKEISAKVRSTYKYW